MTSIKKGYEEKSSIYEKKNNLNKLRILNLKNKKTKNNYLSEYKTLEELPLKLDQKIFWLAIIFKISSTRNPVNCKGQKKWR